MPVTAPAATKGIRPVGDLMVVVCTLSRFSTLKVPCIQRYHDYRVMTRNSLGILPIAIIKEVYFVENVAKVRLKRRLPEIIKGI
jgi:hypothetical protein